MARELGYYDEIEQIDVVEPDRVFVEVCKEFFPDNACGLSDERVTVYYEDGLKFLRMKHDEYDLIINDAIDPLGHTAGLFTKEFYGNCFRALKDDGIMVYQHGSPFYDEDEESCRGMHRKASHSFPISACIRHTYRRVLPATGCSGLRQRNIIRSMIWMQSAGKSGR